MTDKIKVVCKVKDYPTVLRATKYLSDLGKESTKLNREMLKLDKKLNKNHERAQKKWEAVRKFLVRKKLLVDDDAYIGWDSKKGTINDLSATVQELKAQLDSEEVVVIEEKATAKKSKPKRKAAKKKVTKKKATKKKVTKNLRGNVVKKKTKKKAGN